MSNSNGDGIAVPALAFAHTLHDDVVHVTPSPDASALGREGRLFAVVRVQGKQFVVSAGDAIMVDHVAGVSVGQTLPLAEVLLLGGEDVTLVGRPLVAEARVSAVVEEHTQTEKVQVFKKKRRKGYSRRMGFRADVTVLRITSVTKEQQ